MGGRRVRSTVRAASDSTSIVRSPLLMQRMTIQSCLADKSTPRAKKLNARKTDSWDRLTSGVAKLSFVIVRSQAEPGNEEREDKGQRSVFQ